MGGGVFCYLGSPVLTNNTISGNRATAEWSFGGGVHCESSSPDLTHNTIVENTADIGGGVALKRRILTGATDNIIGGTVRRLWRRSKHAWMGPRRP